MRITCDLDVANRLLPSFNMRNKGKACRAQLSVGRKPGDDQKTGEVYLMVGTKQDRSGSAKYKLRTNVENFFVKFVNEGKATIRFTEPPHDLCISKADIVQLKSFLSVVRMGHQGQGLDKLSLSALAPVSSKQVEKLKKKLSIMDRRDYPITTNFPRELETLIVQECKLKRIDSRMLQLRRIVSLDLSHNHLKSLPGDFDSVPHLAELRLADNHIEDVPIAFCSGRLAKSLSVLDLSENRIKILRPHFCNLQALSTLKLDKNELQFLPQMLGTFNRLRNFTVTGNQLKTLPVSFTQLTLDTLDLFGNSFLQDGADTARNRLQKPTLLEAAARVIIKHKIPYTEEDVGHLVDFLGTAKKCMCGNYCFRSHVHYLARINLNRISATVTAIDLVGRTDAPVEAFLCSVACYEKYKRNPHATMWRK